jgi:3-hydroxybutyryl-CoA dehydratase
LWDKLGIISGSVVAFYGIEGLRFTKPVFIGDTIHGLIKVTDKQEREDSGMITLSNEVTNQRGESVLTCTAKLIISRKPKN